MNKKSIITLTTLGIMLFGLTTPKPTQAFWPFDAFKSDSNSSTTNDSRPNFMKTLKERLTTRFNLNQSDVEEVFNQVGQERRGYMNKGYEDRLSQAVSDGNLSEEQKQLILQKHEELQNEQLDWNADPEVRREQMQEHHQEMEQWAADNNVPLEDLGFGAQGMGRGMGGGMHRGQR